MHLEQINVMPLPSFQSLLLRSDQGQLIVFNSEY